jgi:hypothetical protein
MNILKTSALSTIIALTAFSANATYDASDNLTIELKTAQALSIIINSGDDTVTFNHLVDGDQLDADVNVNISGAQYVGALASGTRAISCTINGSAIATGVSPTLAITDGGTNITTLTFAMTDCTQTPAGTDNTLNITSTAIQNTAASTTYSVTIPFAVSYDAATAVATYS